jgi:hypothetical protein
MKLTKTKWPNGVLIAFAIVLLASTCARAQPRGPRHDAERQHDMATFHFLLEHRDDIVRKVTKRPDGVETLTESDNPEVTSKLREHFEAMHKRLKDGRPIHMRDPLFREVFRNADKIKMTVEKTDKGLKVSETSQDAYVVRLIQAHAEVLNQFLAKGHEEVRKNHPVPQKSSQ